MVGYREGGTGCGVSGDDGDCVRLGTLAAIARMNVVFCVSKHVHKRITYSRFTLLSGISGGVYA